MYIGYVMQQAPEIRRPPFDGPANHVRHVVHHLIARGHRVRVLAGLDGRIWRSDDLESFEPVVVQSTDQGIARRVEGGVRRIQTLLRLPYAGWFESRRFAAAIRQELSGADLLYERMSWMGYGAGLAAERMKIPLVLEFNGDHLHDLEAKGMAPKGLQRRLSMALMAGAVRRSAHTIASGKGWHEQFIRRYGVAPERVSTVENGTALVELLRREDLRAFSPQDPALPLHIVYLGGFYPWHGVEILLRAFARLRAGGITARLTLIGAGANLEPCKQLAREAGIAADVQFTGQLPAEQYAPLLAEASVGVSPYCGWKEFSGMKLFDYKAAGLAIVASGQNGQPDTLEHGRTGWIIPPCDEDALYHALLRFAQDPALRCALGQAARLDAEQNHSWNHTVELLEQTFLSLTNYRHA